MRRFDEGGHLDVRLVGRNVVHQYEFYDLLEYCWQRLVYTHGVVHLQPVEEVGVHHRHSWHVTIECSPKIGIVDIV